MTVLTRKQKNDLFDLKNDNVIKNDNDNFTILHNVIAGIRAYLHYNNITIYNESQTMYDNKTRIHLFELEKQIIVLSCHGAGFPNDLFYMYDMTLQIVNK